LSRRPGGLTQPAGRPWRHGAACVIAHFRLTPKSSKEAIDGLIETVDGPAFQARVRALPEDGAANTALEELVARWLGIPKRSVSLATGGKSRLKALKIVGDPAALDRLLQDRLSELQK
jgi:uncharacterized protein YggU (UPF0235/DUF167 family)